MSKQITYAEFQYRKAYSMMREMRKMKSFRAVSALNSVMEAEIETYYINQAERSMGMRTYTVQYDRAQSWFLIYMHQKYRTIALLFSMRMKEAELRGEIPF